MILPVIEEFREFHRILDVWPSSQVSREHLIGKIRKYGIG